MKNNERHIRVLENKMHNIMSLNRIIYIHAKRSKAIRKIFA
jgi:hypothetical protein